MRMGLIFFASVLFVIGGMSTATAEESESKEEAVLKVGDKAPNFALPKSDGGEVDGTEQKPEKLSDFKGEKNVLIAFYPKADTPGCTKQLCGYRDDIQKLQSAATEVIAVSTDEQKDSDDFREKFTMPFTVLGNPDQGIVKDYGVPLMERGENHYAQRSVFLVDKAGIVRYIDLDYNIADDKEPLYAAIQALNKPTESKG